MISLRFKFNGSARTVLMHIDADRHFRKLRWHPSNVGKNLQGTAIATYPMIKMPDDVSLPQENANSPFIPIFSPARA